MKQHSHLEFKTLDEKLEHITNNELAHLKEKVASIDGKLWVVLLLLSGVVMATLFK